MERKSIAAAEGHESDSEDGLQSVSNSENDSQSEKEAVRVGDVDNEEES